YLYNTKMTIPMLSVTTLFAGLMAGLFFAWSISVTPGLARLNDRGYIQAFQEMNRAIQNPLFLLVFMGLAILLPLLCFQMYPPTGNIQFWYILGAAMFYLLGVIAVTFMGNIPLNNKLDALNIENMTPEQMASFRRGFEDKWNRLNVIRVICSSISLLSLIMACMQN